MAAIFIIAGGVFGFASAIASLVMLDASVLTALAIWSGTGIVALCLGLVVSMVPRRTSQPKGSSQTAH